MIKNHEHMISLRPAVQDDCMLLLEWRNLPEIVELGTLKSTVSKDEHEEWFAAKLRSADAQIWIVQCDGKPVGQVRLDPQAKQEKIISVFLLSKASPYLPRATPEHFE